MRNILFAVACLCILISCGTPKSSTSTLRANTGPATSNDPAPTFGDSRTITVEYLDQRSYRITETTEDKTYGYEKSNPVKVGGIKEASGPMNERRYLNGLAGPAGEEIEYYRAGSCCGFKTANGGMGYGMLDIYMVYWKGSKDTLRLFINMYDEGDLKVPVGLTAKK
jgi:hypothetical protein